MIRKKQANSVKCVRLLRQTAWNDEEDILRVLTEDDENIYYNDSMGRYCYLPKNQGWFEAVV